MAKYILVHGGSQTGHVWEKLAPLLETRGHQVFCPTLSDPQYSTLDHHISEICQHIQRLEKVILVGHSYGGMVITGVADRLPDKISCMIYVDAAVPENGQSLFDLINATGYSAVEYYGLDPFQPFVEPIHFEDDHLRNIQKIFILCTESEFIHVTQAMANKILVSGEKRWKCIELPTTHAPMVTMPDELFKILIQSS